MKRETLIESSYEAAYLIGQGLEHKVIARHDSRDAEFAFRAGKQLDEARKRYEADAEITAFVELHRRLKWGVSKALKDRDTNEATRSRR